MPRSRSITFGAGAATLAIAACASPRPAAQPLVPGVAFAGITIVDPDAGSLMEDMTVLVAGGRITAVHPARRAVPRGTQVIAAHGQFLMPGLWDAHIHLAASGDTLPAAVAAARDLFMPQLLLHGVTSVRDLGSESGALRVLRDAVDRGDIPGPRIHAAARLIAGHNPWAPGMAHVITVRRPDSSAIAVAQVVADGGLFVKAHDMLSPAAFFAVARAAREAGLPLVGHLRPSVTIDDAVAAGQVGVEHVPIELVAACAGGTGGDALAAADAWYQAWIAGGETAYIVETAALWARRDAGRCASVMRLLRDSSVHVTPTMVLRLQDSLFHHHTGSPWRRTARSAEVCTAVARARAGLPDSLHALHVRTVLDIVGAMHRSGVPLMAGSDGPQGCITPGPALHEELRLLVASGLTPAQALRAATVVPARFLGVSDSVGTIAVGQVADLVLLDANPLADIANARRVRGVMARGRWLPRDELLRMLDEGASRPH